MRSGLEVADVFRDAESSLWQQYGNALRPEQRQAFNAITRCRTAALGGHKQQCGNCGYQRIQYNSCRNRHCPKCQAMARADWLDARESELLPISYFHTVFTLPEQFRLLALQNKRVVYNLLFRAAAETLQEVAANPKHLGAKIGILMVLHTWGQNLMHHPHVHCVVTGGGIDPTGTRWVDCKGRQAGKKPFFLPVGVLSLVFRGKFIHFLKQAYRERKLVFYGRLAGLKEPHEFESLINESVRTKWTVYAKRPFGGPEQVLKYLARYTHRVAISNQRLVDLQGGVVTFRYKDYADDGQTKTMPLSTVEFTRRFLMHTLPCGFVRIRYYGLLANRFRSQSLDRCRELLGLRKNSAETTEQTSDAPVEVVEHPLSPKTCPACGAPSLTTVAALLPVRHQPLSRPHFLDRHELVRKWFDTS